MHRPSHWIPVSFGTFALIVTATGSWHCAEGRHYPPARASDRAVVRAIVAGEEVTLAGLVVDGLGWPIAGATVRLAGSDPVQTDAAGRFALVVRGGQGRVVQIESQGRSVELVAVPGVLALAVLAEGPPAPRAAAGESALLAGEGFLKDAHGEGIAYARVFVRETGASVLADEHGRFRVPLPADGEVTLLAMDGEGRAAASAPLRPTRKQGLVPVADLVLVDGRTLRGFVADASGAPVADAAVVVECGAVRLGTVTGGRGEYAFVGLVADLEWTVCGLPCRGELGVRETVVLRRDEERDLALCAALTTRVRVIGADTGTPLARMLVSAEDAAMRRAHGTTDADGYATLGGIGHGPYRIQVRSAELVPLTIASIEGTVVAVR
jgi:hypothetical protein